MQPGGEPGGAEISNPEQVSARIGSLDERDARLRAGRAGYSPARTRQNANGIPGASLIGGAVLAAIEHEGVPVLKSSSELLRWLDARLTRAHDRAVFELPTSSNAPSTAFFAMSSMCPT
jgi:hypothetical protein